MAALLALTSARSHAQYSFTTIDNPLAYGYNYIIGISNGSVLGYYYTPPPYSGDGGVIIIGPYNDNPLYDAFTYSGGVFTSFGNPAYPNETQPIGVSGTTIVGTNYDASLNAHNFIYQNGVFSSLSVPGAISTSLTGISGSDIFGTANFGSSSSGFVYNGSTYTMISDPLGVNGTYPTGISGGNIIGFYVDSSYNEHGFSYNGTSFTTLDVPGSFYTQINGATGNEIYGTYVSGGATEGFLYDGTNFTTLNDPAGAKGTVISGVDASGDVVGDYTDSSGITHGFEATMVPEPGVFTLLAAGVFAVATSRRRRATR